MTEVGAGRRIVAAMAVACMATLLAPQPSGASPAGSVAVRAAVPSPVVGPAVPVSEPVPSPGPGYTLGPVAAFDGQNHLVVWWEYARSGGPTYDIYAARVTPSGTVLDPTGIAIATGASNDVQPDVSFGGGTFLVVWTSTTDVDSDVLGTRVDRSGAVLDPAGIPIGVGPSGQGSPTVAYGDGAFLVAWNDGRLDPTGSGVVGARVDPSGTVLDPAGITISTGADPAYEPAVAFGGGVFLLAWTVNRLDVGRRVAGARVDRSGSVLDPAGVPISADGRDHSNAAVAFNGTDFLVVWESWGDSPRVLGARVGPGGAVLDPAGIAVAPSGPYNQINPSVASSGSSFLVVFYGGIGDSLGLVGARVGPDGGARDPAGLVLVPSVRSSVGTVDVISSGTGYFAAWEDERLGATRPHVFAGRVTAAGVPAPAVNVDRAANDQSETATGFDGENFLVLTSDTRSGGGYDLYGARVSASGQMLDGSGFLIARDYYPYGGVDLAFDGENFLVAWTSGGRARAVRVSRDGVVLEPQITLPNQRPAYSVGVAFNGTDFLVTFGESDRSGFALRAARVNRSGVLLDPAGTLISNQGSIGDVASDGRGFLVVGRIGADVVGFRVRADGSLVDPAGFVILAGPDLGGAATIAWNGRTYLVVAPVSPFGGEPTRILAVRVSQDGAVQDPGGILVGTASPTDDPPQPEVAANGPFLVVWRDRRQGANAVLGARVGDDGAVLDTPAFVVDDAPAGRGHPSVGAATDGWGVASSRFVPEPPYSVNRAFLRTVRPK
jgi:hypothetical protein